MIPILFTIFIVDIDKEVLCEISKFADETKIASRVNTLNDIKLMQRTLGKLVAWANRWDMEFNVNIYRVMYNNAYSEKKFSFSTRWMMVGWIQ